jgi:hypothetical protein
MKIEHRTPVSNPSRRDVLVEECREAAARHIAATPNVFLLHVADHLRRRPDHDTVGLGYVVRRLDDLRRGQPTDAPLIVGTAAISRLIDRIIAAFERGQP